MLKGKAASALSKIFAVIFGIDAVWDLLGKITAYLAPVNASETVTATTTLVTTVISLVTTTTFLPHYTLLPFTQTSTSVTLNGVGLSFTPLPYGPALIFTLICAVVWRKTRPRHVK
jgi:carbohydrate-binding DOMON domain-containing protein